MRYIITIEFYFAKKRKKFWLYDPLNKKRNHAASWIQLKIIMLYKRNQIQEGKHHIFLILEH